MNTEDIVKAWRDEEFRENLVAEVRKRLPESPAGNVELSESELGELNAGSDTIITFIASVAAGGSCRVGTDGCCPATT